jgi:DNA-binding transcriptional LysR family regulator
MQMLLAAALRGSGLAYGPSFVFDAHLSTGELVPLLPDHRTSSLAIHAVYPSSRHLPSKVRAFVDHLAGSLGEQRGRPIPAVQ